MPEIRLTNLIIDASIQPRAKSLDQGHVDEMCAALLAGNDLPNVVAYKTDDGVILSEGFHRAEAYKRANKAYIPCDLRTGTRTDAILNAMASNQSHGLKRTNADKRRAVEETLKVAADWSDRKIADHLGVSHTFVSEARPQLATVASSTSPEVCTEPQDPAKRTGKDGKQRPATQPKKAEAKPTQAITPTPAVSTPKPVNQPEPSSAESEPENTTGQEAAPEVEPERNPYKVPTTDTNGIPIQEWAIEAFESVPEFRDMIRIVKALRQRLSSLADTVGGRYLQRNCQWTTLGKNPDGSERGAWRNDHLENLLMLLEDRVPMHTDCPYAFNPFKAHDATCNCCKGMRWTPKQHNKSTPKECLAARDAHYGIVGGK